MSTHTHSPPTLSASPAPLSPASSTGTGGGSAPGVIGAPVVPPAGPNMGGADPSSGPVRRKTSRRANTAERRATHNAVERQRRETLNGRFLDLAALLPNLAAVRRPSKSAIVNSSIALIHTQRRQRAFAGREVRALKAETDMLRREINEWRERAGGGVISRMEEPVRSAEFIALLGLEDVSVAEEEEIRRAYEMASIPLGDEDDDGFVDAPQGYEQHMPTHHHHAPAPQHQPHVPVHHHQAHPHLAAPPPPAPAHHGYAIPPVPQSAPAHMTHHQIPMPAPPQQLEPQQVVARPQTGGGQSHIPAFDGPSMFPGPGHHNGHAHHASMGGGMVFGNQYGNTSPGVSGSPPHSAHAAAHFAQQQAYGAPRQTSPPQLQQQSYPSHPREASHPFAHSVPIPVRDDDHTSTSGSSAGGSPPATGHSQFASGPYNGQEVPTLAAGATPADFARFWGATAPHAPMGGPGQKMGVQSGFAPMGFAM